MTVRRPCRVIAMDRACQVRGWRAMTSRTVVRQRCMSEISTLLAAIAMGESARWHDGRFWCSDWVAGEILVSGLAGDRRVAARSTSFPFCFDWLADGTMLV